MVYADKTVLVSCISDLSVIDICVMFIVQQTFVGFEDVLKASSRHVLKTLQHVFTVRVPGLPRRLEEILKMS